jgi:MarR-like DNA-binding transcriptional regulator SgrR of sgrS sRNA
MNSGIGPWAGAVAVVIIIMRLHHQQKRGGRRRDSREERGVYRVFLNRRTVVELDASLRVRVVTVLHSLERIGNSEELVSSYRPPPRPLRSLFHDTMRLRRSRSVFVTGGFSMAWPAI